MIFPKSNIPTPFLEWPCRHFETMYLDEQSTDPTTLRPPAGAICHHSGNFLFLHQDNLPCSLECPNYELVITEEECLICGSKIEDLPLYYMLGLTADNVIFCACSPDCLAQGEKLNLIKLISGNEDAKIKGKCSTCDKTFETPLNQELLLYSLEKGAHEFCSLDCYKEFAIIPEEEVEDKRKEHCRYYNQEHLYNKIVNLPRNLENDITCHHPLHQGTSSDESNPEDCASDCPDYLPITYEFDCPFCQGPHSIREDELNQVWYTPHWYCDIHYLSTTFMIENFYLSCEHCFKEFVLVLDL